jgi:hypothetical protein
MDFKLYYTFTFLFVSLFAVAQTYEDSPRDFFFSDEIGEKPKMMSPGFISTGMNELNGSLGGDDDDEYYYCLHQAGGVSVIVVTRFEEGFWRYPEVVSFSGQHFDSSPFVSYGGEYLYFASNRPADEFDDILDWNIWRSSRMTDKKWDEPDLLSFCSETRNEMSVSIDREGELFFYADYSSGTISSERDSFDIYSVKMLENGEWGEPEKLGAGVNTSATEQTPAISPDGVRLVFSSVRKDGFGGEDLYVSYRSDDGWSEAQNLGEFVNSATNECCPVFTSDGKLLLFTSFVKKAKPDRLNYKEIKKWVLGPGNGAGDIWYMNADDL